MKRWQDRGEVLDSDDEELAESQSQEKIAKETNLVEDAQSVDGLRNEENQSFVRELLQHAAQNGEQSQGEHDGFRPITPTADPEPNSSSEANDDHVLTEPLKRNENHDFETSLATQSSVHSRRTENPQEHSSGPESLHPEEFDGFPDTGEPSIDKDAEGQTEEPQFGSRQSTALSSPLSERAVSPFPPYQTFYFPKLGHQPSRNASPDLSDEDNISNPRSVDAGPALDNATTSARRSLRARKEKQLHPYLFDRAQHQKQFRERGMRPIRVDLNRSGAVETQEVSFSGDEREDGSGQSSSGNREPPSSAPGELSCLNNAGNNALLTSQPPPVDSDEELPELSALFRQPAAATTQYGNKRRKLFHSSRANVHSTAQQPHTSFLRTQDEFSIPPSPPPTSSGSTSRAVSHHAAASFRVPPGLTPEALPTPQISSELRGHLAEPIDADESENELPTRRSRTSVQSRRVQQPIAIESSAESSEAETESRIADQRLQRERKRIKGVLPASWLKIDLRAQQKQVSPSPRRARRQSSPSPPRTLQQKGVAQKRISKAFPGRQDTINISDDESEEEQLRLSPSPPQIRQLKLRFEQERATAAPSDFVDDERMEVDWVDPMLAGSSRPRSERKQHKKRQPRITDSFRGHRPDRVDFSEERNAIRRATGASPAFANSRSSRPRKKLPKKFVKPRLSILDAPESAKAAGHIVPQFVRVAMRKARQHAGRGRHSPTGKHIRLATREDTEDATSILRAWREGTIVPRSTSDQRSDDHVIDLASASVSDAENHQRFDARRKPLAEVEHNRQQRLPDPLHKHGKKRAIISSTHTYARGPRMRQTQLRPITMLDDDSVDKQLVDRGRTTAPPGRAPERHKRQELLVHTDPIRCRGAQLESLEVDLSIQRRAAAFQHRMHCLTENIIRPHREFGGGFQLARFLHSDDAMTKEIVPVDRSGNRNGSNRLNKKPDTETPKVTLPRRPRKRQPHRIDAEAREYRQPSEPLPETLSEEPSIEELPAAEVAFLHGLGPFGTRYATDFDILPLQLGTYFHETSFIGSGDFAASLNLANRDLDCPTGRIRVHLGVDVLEWGAWTEDVAAGLSRLPHAISDALQSIRADEASPPDQDTLDLILSNVDYLLRSTVRYFTRCLAFLDPVDRRRCIDGVHHLTNDLLEVFSEYESIRDVAGKVLARGLQYVLVLSKQLCALCDHHIVPTDIRARSRELVLSAASRLAGCLVSSGLQDLREFYEANRHVSKRDVGIRDTDIAICSVLILFHVTRDLDNGYNHFWSALYKTISVNILTVNTVSALDKAWYDIFTLLPALEIDATGIVRTGSRFQDMGEDWTYPRCLVERLLQLYPSTTLSHGSTVNDYVRATFTRCSYLISRWGWWRCDALLGTVFDFFARRGLSQLQKEESRGSPRFLEELNQQPTLEIQAEDRSFHIFLKMLALGLQGMRKHRVYPDKKIAGIAWRFIPNHGRTHRKDAELHQEDLDSLRNHHDLLCTLYYAAPPGHRLRANLIQNLVDHSISHREACRLNVRAWATLASFQASTTEPNERLEDFCAWYGDIMSTTVNQYRLARNEVEQEVAYAREQGRLEPSSAVVEDTIMRNQRQIGATLVDTLAALHRALRSSYDAANAVYLLSGSSFWQVFDIFDPSARRLYGVLHEALDMMKTALNIDHRPGSKSESQQVSDDSQEYGDSNALQELASTQAVLQSSSQNVVEVLHEPLAQLVSNVFGADVTTDDALLIKVVDAWAQLAQCTVRTGHRTWSSYISGYSSDAWTQLRDTAQRRKYTPYFLSRVIELGDVKLSEADILTSWLKSLVEREATLRFQHTLTNALLNHHPQEPILVNLPFSRHIRAQYEISLQDLRQRRLALISSLLFNIRHRFDYAPHERSNLLSELRQTYAAMLRQLMQAMKDNYQELQSSRNADVANAQAQGTYVEFVQQVVSFLQQYTTEICTVDRFFTDSTAFPLPATDPTYVVGRLKSYVPKLGESRKRKELAVFVQAVSERAAVDGQQTYLVDQLASAMSGLIEHGDQRRPSLRQVLCSSIFPAYIESALTTAYSWIVAIPVVEACARIANGLLYSTKIDNRENVNTICDTVAVLLQSSGLPLRAAVTHPGRLSLPHIQATLSAIFNFVKACLTPVNFFHKTWHAAGPLISTIHYFYEYATCIDAHLTGIHETEMIVNDPVDTNFHCLWPDTLDFVRKQIHDKFTNEWHAHDGHYYVRRGNHSVEIVMHLEDEERLHLVESLKEFRECYEAIFDGQIRTKPRVDGDCNVDGVIV